MHLGLSYGGHDLEALDQVIKAAHEVSADILLLAGDIFDHNRLPLAVLDQVARVMGDSGVNILILPGNHDCLIPNSVYRRGGLAEPANVEVLGITVDESKLYPEFDLEIWGRPHLDHADMSPLRDPRPRKTGRQVVTAHGHWVTGPADMHRAWLIHDEEVAATGADYVALGHWDRALPVGDGSVPAFYSGSPDLARTVNVVRFTGATMDVTRHPLS